MGKGVVSKEPKLPYNFTYNIIAPAQGMRTTRSSHAAHPVYVILHVVQPALLHQCVTSSMLQILQSHNLSSPRLAQLASQVQSTPKQSTNPSPQPRQSVVSGTVSIAKTGDERTHLGSKLSHQ